MSEHDLTRFVEAQEAGDTYKRALGELRAGRKRGHWIWFVLPQLAGLGRSPTSRHYAIQDLAQARQYVAHPVLGPRLIECATAIAALSTSDAVAVMGSVDAQKLHSCMTLFAAAAPDEPVFTAVLAKFFGNRSDDGTTALLRR